MGVKEEYDNLYRRGLVWGSESHGPTRRLAALARGRVLDIGAGDGRDSIYLVEKGFDVTAVDASPLGLQKIREWAAEHSKPVRTVVCDARHFDMCQGYDAIISYGTLNLMPKADARALIERMQRFTRAGGCNALGFFMRDDAYPSPMEPFEPGELGGVYDGWDVVSYNEYKRLMCQLPHNSRNWTEILARKT